MPRFARDHLANLVIESIPARSVVCEDDVTTFTYTYLSGVDKALDGLQIAAVMISIRNRPSSIEPFCLGDGMGESLDFHQRRFRYSYS